VKYAVPSAQNVTLQMFDVSGRLVKTLVNGPKSPGNYQATWNGRADNGRALVNGIYFCRLQAKKYEKTVKLLLSK
jgi:flagellar hook assembly protein FlgD